MRIKALLIIIICMVMTMSCKKIDVSPQLEISVLDVNGNYIHGAEVKLFIDDTDWYNDENSIVTEYTNKDGKILFVDLEEVVYYFKAKKDTLDNYYGNSALKAPLKLNYKTKVYTIIY